MGGVPIKSKKVESVNKKETARRPRIIDKKPFVCRLCQKRFAWRTEMAEHEVQCGNTSTRLNTRSKANYGGLAGPVLDKRAETDTTLRNIATVDSERDSRGDVDSSGVSDEELVDENIEGIEVDPWQMAREGEANADTEDMSKKGVEAEKTKVNEALSGFRFVSTSDMNTNEEEVGEKSTKKSELLVNQFNFNPAVMSNRSSFRGGSIPIDQNVLNLGLKLEINASNDRKIIAKK